MRGRNLATFTLGEVARDLGVSTASLYRVADGRDDLVLMALRDIADGMRRPDPSGTWQDIIRDYCNVFFAELLANPGMPAAILGTPGAHSAAQDYIRATAAALTGAGFPGDDADIDFAVGTLGSYAIASALTAETMLADDGSGTRGIDVTRRMLDRESEESGVPSRVYPAEDWTVGEGLRRFTEFFIAGLEHGLHHEALRELGRL
ncbi:TetR/AcrR family transcriptional regulator [Corynebacterium sp. 335C]